MFIASIILYSCSKDDVKQTNHSVTNQSQSNIVFDIQENNNSNAKSNTGERTILGKIRHNPFTTENMAIAHNNLYNTDYTEMPTTDKYLMYTPTTDEEVKLLFASDLILYDYDLRYEVVSMGDYYQEPIENGYPTFYTVVSINKDLPEVPYETICDLYLDQSNPLLIAEAYLITDNITDIYDLTGYSLEEIGDINIEYIMDNTDELDCNAPCVIKYRMVTVNEDGQTRVVIEAYCDCEVASEVGCTTTGNMKKPYGNVRVFDTQLSNANNTNTYMGVGGVKVIIKDNWFNSFAVQTNIHGCYKFDREFWGRIWIYIKYKGDKCKVRSKKSGWHNYFSYFYAIEKYVGKATNHNYSNMITNIHYGPTAGSLTNLMWGGATIMNAVNEFHNYAIQEGINPPPNNLDIYAWPNGGHTGFASMATQLGPIKTALAITLGNATPDTYIIDPFIFINLVNLHFVIPDVMISIDFKKSDRLKHLANHELTHASHYTAVTNAYWMDIIASEIKADHVTGSPHGNPNSWQAGKIALTESWAEHIGMSFTQKSYPLSGNTSIGNITYIEKLEKTWNESDNHIPIGIYLDLIDNGVEPQSYNRRNNSSTTVLDNVSGFTNQQIFNCLNSNTINPSIFKQQLINNYLNNTSNTTNDVDDLFNSY